MLVGHMLCVMCNVSCFGCPREAVQCSAACLCHAMHDALILRAGMEGRLVVLPFCTVLNSVATGAVNKWGCASPCCLKNIDSRA
jgi:hypothetical protein